MARYIDADRLIEILLDREGKSKGICGDLGGAVMGCIRLVEATPAADVVPKSEVEAMQRLYGEKLEVAEALIATLNKTKSEVAREIFEEIEKAIEKCKYNQSTPFGIEERYNPYAIIKQVAKLKKKYTETCTDCQHFVGCEKAVWSGPCEEHTEKESTKNEKGVK